MTETIDQIEIEHECEQPDDWYRAVRADFNPGEREPCAVCGKYRSLAHAHHIVPLARQHGMEKSAVDHRHVWLCPTHHAAVHAFIANAEGRPFSATRCAIVMEIARHDNAEMMAIHRVAMEAQA